MKINYTKGNKGEKDGIIQVSTREREWFSIFKLALLTNQLATNEMNIHGEAIQRTGNFFFGNALKEAVDMAEKGIDWGEEENSDAVREWCNKWMVKFEPVEQELRKCWQSKLEDFENEKP
ncbi:hypothetical protein LCGC14_2637050 [marine sediment metagenome]|uniref:Uncharacterized protein n=1 Tax=marine sediment metagenome TaxID=412755 RepID=A0A0F8ZYS6_9ZZZZ